MKTTHSVSRGFTGSPAKHAQTARAAVLAFVCLFFCAALSAAAQDESPRGQVIFSRSTNANGVTKTTIGPGIQPLAAGGRSVPAPTATDAEREAVTFTAFKMDVHLRTAEHRIAVRALVTVRNDGTLPLTHVPLQISSSLQWESIRVDERDVPFTVATLNSDVDHTGQLHEATIKLATALAPGATLQIDVAYSGAIVPSAQRLIVIGTPQDVALHSDWDAIDTGFTGLRGFGNVVWYPACAPPAMLGDGARVFDEMGEHKLRLSGALFSLHLAVEFPSGYAPTVALIDGHSVPLAITEPQYGGGDISGVATATLASTTLGFDAPSIFVAVRHEHHAANTVLWTLPAGDAAASDWSTAASAVTPFLQNWLGQTPRSALTILDLHDPEDAPYQTGSLLVAAVRPGAQDRLTGLMVQSLTRAWMSSPRAWLSEGAASFMGTLWLEKQSGREKALEALESGRTALALVEPPSPGVSFGQPLAQAIAPAYYRTKAAYVFWMLRDLAGDPALSAAFSAYSPAADAATGLGPASSSVYFEKLFDRAGLRGDRSWFFADWIDADKGLPDIAIDKVFPASVDPVTQMSSSSSGAAPVSNAWLVTVDLSNSGYAAAEIPVTVRSALTSATQRILVPARGTVTQHILILGRPTEVQANDGTVPETAATIHILHLAGGDSSSQQNAPAATPQ